MEDEGASDWSRPPMYSDVVPSGKGGLHQDPEEDHELEWDNNAEQEEEDWESTVGGGDEHVGRGPSTELTNRQLLSTEPPIREADLAASGDEPVQDGDVLLLDLD